jgi:methionine--tRNA ligase beta chain
MAPYESSLASIDALIAAITSGSTSQLPSGVPGSSKPAPAAKPAAQKPAAPKAAPAEGKKAAPVEGRAAKPAKAPKAEGDAKPVKALKPAGAASAHDRPVDISWLDLRVGKIIDAKPHPESDKLYIEQIDVGEDVERPILSGLAQFMPLDAVKGALVVVVCNLPPRPIAGVTSFGMVLCASEVDAAGNKVKTEFVRPPAGARVGERIVFDAHPGEPEAANKIKKKKGWETCAPDLATDANCVATYKGDPFKTSAGPCTAATVKMGPIS